MTPSMNFGNGLGFNNNYKAHNSPSSFNNFNSPPSFQNSDSKNNSSSGESTPNNNYPNSFSGPPMPVGRVTPKLAQNYGGLNVKADNKNKNDTFGGPMRRNQPIGGFQPRLGKVEKDVGW